MRRLSTDDTGAVAATVALLLVVIVGMSALVVDMGYWYTCRRQLQAAADSAALAGCQELIIGGSNAEIWNKVEEYAGSNIAGPLQSIQVVPVSGGGLSDITSDSVKVTCTTNARSFFGGIFGITDNDIEAQSVAKVGYVYGTLGPVPWSISILRATEVRADIDGIDIPLHKTSDDEWVGTIPASASGPVTIEALNERGFSEVFEDLVSVGEIPSGGRFTRVDASKTTMTSGVDGSVYVEAALSEPLEPGEKVEAALAGSKTELSLADAATNTYAGYLSAPTTERTYETVPLTVTVGKGNKKDSVRCDLLLRRANYIIGDVSLSENASLSSKTISVKFVEFTYGVEYQLKVEGGGGELGSFMALDLETLDHSDCGFTATVLPGQSGASDYRTYVAGDAQVEMHINDYVTTKPGNMAGPTSQGLDSRFSGVTMVSFAAWEAAGKPGTKQVVVVPITERLEDLGGRTRLVVVSFASFFIEEVPGHVNDENIVGRFIEYTTPGWVVGPNPPNPDFAIEAPHLVKDGLDF